MTAREDILRQVEERAEKILADAPKKKTHWWIIGGAAAILAVIAVFLISGRSSYSIKDSNNATIIGSANNVTINNHQILNLYADLPDKEKAEIKTEAFVYFPEIFSMTNRDKFARFNEWLQKEKSVNHKNARDLFSAGGKKTITIGDKDFEDTPQILVRLQTSLDDVIDCLKTADKKNLQKYWGAVEIPDSPDDRLALWAKLVDDNMDEDEARVFRAMIQHAQARN